MAEQKSVGLAEVLPLEAFFGFNAAGRWTKESICRSTGPNQCPALRPRVMGLVQEEDETKLLTTAYGVTKDARM